MSTSANMLRTRRKDNNVKPNRRLDRKSSRGMIFENEELRLKTININAEVERGQNDIKKLKRENDQLRREIWYLRDEYNRLDKLLRTKQAQCMSSSSSTSCSSESESCSSCTEETDEIEMSQNLANVQKTALSNFHKDFDHLSVVPEENSAENSERNSSSNRASSSNDPWDKDVIKPDQSYPNYENISATKDAQDNFFPQILPNQHYEDASNNQFLGLEQPTCGFPMSNDQHLNLCVGQNLKNSLQSGSLPKDAVNRQHFFDNPPLLIRQNAVSEKMFSIKPDIRYYQNLSFYNNETDHLENAKTLPVMQKAGTDLIAKTDNRDFCTLRSQSSFSNGGNLEELLNDIETISQDILKISNIQRRMVEGENENYNQPTNIEDVNFHVQNHSNIKTENERKNSTDTQDSSYRSQLNLIVMPTPMPLIGVEKYRNLQKSCESLGSQSLENLSSSKTNLKILEETGEQTAIIAPDKLKRQSSYVPVPPVCPSPNRTSPLLSLNSPINPSTPNARPKRPDTPNRFNNFTKNGFSPIAVITEQGPPVERKFSSNFADLGRPPFFFGNYENHAYSSENILEDVNSIQVCQPVNNGNNGKDGFDKISSENEENLKFNAPRVETNGDASEKSETKTPDLEKPPKLSIRRKVSIHFKGKKDKNTGGKNDQKTPSTGEKKSPFFDIKFHTEVKGEKKSVPKTPASTPVPKTPNSEAKFVNLEQKPTTNTDSKCSAGDNKTSVCDSKSSSDQKSSIVEAKSSNSDAKTSSGEQKGYTTNGEIKESKSGEQKQRKSISVSPEHGKHKHGKDGEKKCHKKHKKGDKGKHRKGSLTTDRFLRERSFSVCTDRSNILDHRLALGYGFGFYDDLSDKDRCSDSSCDSNASKSRKISMISNIPTSGKIPWCGCWGNGCV